MGCSDDKSIPNNDIDDKESKCEGKDEDLFPDFPELDSMIFILFNTYNYHN